MLISFFTSEDEREMMLEVYSHEPQLPVHPPSTVINPPDSIRGKRVCEQPYLKQRHVLLVVLLALLGGCIAAVDEGAALLRVAVTCDKTDTSSQTLDTPITSASSPPENGTCSAASKR